MVKNKVMKMEKIQMLLLLKIYSESLFTGTERGGINPKS